MSYKAHSIIKVCETKAGVQFKGTKEVNGWVCLADGKKACRVTVPKGRKDVPKGTLGSIRRQLHLTAEEFTDFVECTMNSKEYIELVEQRTC